MEQKINIAELLKDCPKGMELDCTMFDKVEFDRVDKRYSSTHPIVCNVKTNSGNSISYSFDEYGRFCSTTYSKCVIFPKGKTTWEGFQRPFKDGDILAYDINSTKSTVFIYRYDNPHWNTSYFVALSGFTNRLITDATGALRGYEYNVRFATQEETERLFKAITSNGYKWDTETKTLKKLSTLEFKEGDVVVSNKGDIHLLRTTNSSYCAYRERWEGLPKFDHTITTEVKAVRIATEEEKQKLFDTIKEKGFKWNFETKTLEKLTIPEFEDGDIVATSKGEWVGITLGGKVANFIPTYCVITSSNRFMAYPDKKEKWAFDRLATEKEKERLFNAIKENGLKWNPETKTLEKLCPFNPGDVLISGAGNLVLFSHIDEAQTVYYHCILFSFGDHFIITKETSCGVGLVSNCKLATTEQRNQLFDRLQKRGYKYNPQTNKLEELLIEPNFKVGDRIRNTRSNSVGVIENLTSTGYDCRFDYGYFFISFKDQHNFILVPNKFDITTLKPFDKVLIRNSNNGYWRGQFYMNYNKNLAYPFECSYNCWLQCIPYKGNEHLLGTTDNCDDFYKIWE